MLGSRGSVRGLLPETSLVVAFTVGFLGALVWIKMPWRSSIRRERMLLFFRGRRLLSVTPKSSQEFLSLDALIAIGSQGVAFHAPIIEDVRLSRGQRAASLAAKYGISV